MNKKNLNRQSALNLTGFGLIAAAAVIVVLTLVMNTRMMDGKYNEFLNSLMILEERIVSLPYKWLIAIAILAVFLIKNIIPIPVPFICLMSGMVFEPVIAVAVNTAGFALLLYTKYMWGKKAGGGVAVKTLKRYDNVREMMDRAGNGKLAVLVALRIIPSLPVNAVSKIYGGMNFPVGRFMIASLIGLLPKILSYSYMGSNFSQPFTWKFMAPVVALLLISGVSTLTVNSVLEKRKGEGKNGKCKTAEE